MDQEQLLLKESGGTRSLGRNALSLTVVSAMGVGCSLLVDALVVAYFGLGWNTNTYFVAMTVPMLLATALALQASQVVQPLFIHTREEEGEQPGWDVLNLIITTSTGIVFILAVLGVLSSALLIRTQSPGLDERSLALATRLSWLFFLILPMYCPITIVSGALTRFGSFALPGAAALFVSVSRLIFLVIFHRQLGVFALAWGTSVGLLTHLALSYWALRKRGYRYQWHFSLRHPLFARSCRMMRFPLTAQLAGVGAEVANNALGSMVGAGAISALRVATRIVDSLAGLFGSGIVTATAPTLTGNLAVGDTRESKGEPSQRASPPPVGDDSLVDVAGGNGAAVDRVLVSAKELYDGGHASGGRRADADDPVYLLQPALGFV